MCSCIGIFGQLDSHPVEELEANLLVWTLENHLGTATKSCMLKRIWTLKTLMIVICSRNPLGKYAFRLRSLTDWIQSKHSERAGLFSKLVSN